jgi:hypothetical protein
MTTRTRDEQRRRRRKLDQLNRDALDENGLVRPGATYRVPMFFADGVTHDDAEKRYLQDAFRAPTQLGHRPSFIMPDAATKDFLNLVHAMHDADEEERWQNPPQHDAPAERKVPDSSKDAATTDARRKAYELRDWEDEHRWRGEQWVIDNCPPHLR